MTMPIRRFPRTFSLKRTLSPVGSFHVPESRSSFSGSILRAAIMPGSVPGRFALHYGYRVVGLPPGFRPFANPFGPTRSSPCSSSAPSRGPAVNAGALVSASPFRFPGRRSLLQSHRNGVAK